MNVETRQYQNSPTKSGSLKINWLNGYYLAIRKMRAVDNTQDEIIITFESAEEMKSFLSEINLAETPAKLFNAILTKINNKDTKY